MRRSTIVFFLFLVLVGAIFGANEYFKNQPPYTITLAVDPLIETWARETVEAFNATNALAANGTRKVSVRLESVVNDVAVWQGRANWAADNHPALWLASSSLSADFAPANFAYTTLAPSIARTPLLWGGFSSRVAVMDANRVLDWDIIQRTTEAQRWANLPGGMGAWGNVNMGINWGTNSMSGVMALASAVAFYNDSPQLTRNTTSNTNFGTWFLPIREAIQNAQRLGESPALAMASRGASVADFALLPESQWLMALSALVRQEPIVLTYPRYQMWLDFPLLAWEDANTTDLEREAVRAFANYLQSPESQQRLLMQGLRPAFSDPTDSDSIFATAVPYGVQLTLPSHSTVESFERGLAEELLRLLN